MLITHLDSAKIRSTIQAIPMAEDEVLTLLIATEFPALVQPLIQTLQEQGRPFFGAIFPGIIPGKNEITKGIIIKKWKAAAPPIIVKNLANRQLSGLEELQVPATTLIQAAQAADDDCKEVESVPLHAPETMVVNCISRKHFLKNAFEDEMQIIVDKIGIAKEALPHGILSLGEISSYGTGLLDIFNKTIVVGTFSH